MHEARARIIGISRHRLSTDGEGVTTLVAFHGCPNHCRHCLNPQSLDDDRRFKEYTPQSLYDEIKVDELYFIATNGGVAFGGGEPAMYPDFISLFRDYCGPNWQITLETALNVPQRNIKNLIPIVDRWIIDIKDMDANIYQQYTGNSNILVKDNLKLIADASLQSRCIIRIPLIRDFNNNESCNESINELLSMGFSKFNQFKYLIHTP